MSDKTALHIRRLLPDADGRDEFDHQLLRALHQMALWIERQEASPLVLRGAGSPEGQVTGYIGQVYERLDGATLTALYVKVADDGGVTGWVAK